MILLFAFMLAYFLDKSDDFVKFNGHKYKVYKEAVSWSDAKEICEKAGGHLVTINSEDEQNFINHLLLRDNANCYWTGGIKVPGSWQWVTGENITYRNWAKGEPNNLDGDETVMMIYGKNSSNIGQWNDESPFGNPHDEFYSLKNFGYICEWE